MTVLSLFRRETLDVGCLVEINHTPERFGAHVHLDGEPEIEPGDRVCVYGEPIEIVPGRDMAVRRRARIERAPAWERAWTRLRGQFEIAELYEVSFTTAALSGRNNSGRNNSGRNDMGTAQ